MPTITWIEGQPSDGSAVVEAPDFVRRVWKNTALGLDASLYWPGSGLGSQASIGELRPGASRVYVGLRSSSSLPADGRGRLFFASDTSRLFVYSSGRTALVGTPYFVEHPNNPAGTSTWVEQSGSYTTNTGGTFVAGVIDFTFFFDPATTPQVLLFSGSTNHKCQVSAVARDNFQSNVSGPAGSVTYYWSALGELELERG